ncbi:flagellar assembly peptidoglycan hydrolase FlgJ [Variovorax dokdonensis]|uniref:Peptidoglycan hydrolase FlgJ n=1 Tax=Variovorax dokdonensis TaxID=344883 RepID=A0ABT7N4U0_9BURK|nr:flagellar assembly peptidoglycan hydrolase FlgJ [Variovorax dokdonensis]MDM0042940.1 flagellar assembly peptidoglycan hydrolase FlgJ [Variovorax dokdonensis]
MTALQSSRAGALDQRFALDMQGVDALRRTVHASPEEGLRQASRQFEAMFMNMVIKSMRESVPQSGLFDSQSQRLYTSMLDQQLAQNLSGRGVGLAEAMMAQLQRQVASGSTDMDLDAPTPTAYAPLGRDGAAPSSAASSLQSSTSNGVPRTASASRMARADLSVYAANADGEAQSSARASLQSHVDSFVQRMGASAESAADATGVPAPLILAQAALESGWGKREIRGDDGTQSFNLFGIKADKSWRGPSVEVWTTEYVDGEPQRVRAKFRAYGSYEEAFTDYARFLTRNPRYANVLNTDDAAEAAHGLQRAGYATDPNYGHKLVRIMQQLG